jgi:hypothetical protein
MTIRHSRRLSSGFLFIGLCLLAVPIASAQGGWFDRFTGQTTQSAAPAGTLIKVRGNGSVPAPPDQAVVTLGVQRLAAQPAAALSASNDAVAEVVAALTKAGVPATALRTGQFSLVAEPPPAGGSSANSTAARSYRVLNTVTLTTDQPADVGRLIDAAVAAGADEVQGLQFGVADPARYRAAALRAAVAAAAADGRTLAALLGAGEPRVVAVDTLDGSAPSPAGLTGAPPLFPGQSTVDAAVELTLAIDQARLPVAARATATARATVPVTATRTVTATRATTGVTATGTVTVTAAATPQATSTLRVPATTGAAGSGSTAPVAAGGTLPFVPVAQASNGRYRGTRSRAYVVTSAADWERMVAPLLPAGVQVNPDYAKETVIAVFLGERPGSGYGVTTRGVRARDGVLQLDVDVTEPASTPERDSAPTSPYQILTIRTADLPQGGGGLLQAEVAP